MLSPPQFHLQHEDVERLERFRRSKDTAILTIMFTDIVGYTHFTEVEGETLAGELRRIHDSIFHEVVSRDGAGDVIKQIGDSFLAVFSEPTTAVQRSLEFQQRLKEASPELTRGSYTLRVRIGLHVGQVSVENSIQPDIFGRHVNRASRIEAIAGPGQVLTSRSVWDDAAGWFKNRRDFSIGAVAWGKVQLKGITEPVEVFEFFSGDSKPVGMPKAVRTRRRARAAKTAGIGLLAVGCIAVAFYWMNSRQRDELLLATALDTLYLSPLVGYDSTSLAARLFMRLMPGYDSTLHQISRPPESIIAEANKQMIPYVVQRLHGRFYTVGPAEVVESAARAGRLLSIPTDYISFLEFAKSIPECNF